MRRGAGLAAVIGLANALDLSGGEIGLSALSVLDAAAFMVAGVLALLLAARLLEPATTLPVAVAFAWRDVTRVSGAGAKTRLTPGHRIAPVEHFYRVSFGDDRLYRAWAERVVEFTSLLNDIAGDQLPRRPVIFAPLLPRLGKPTSAYVSGGARGLAAHLFVGAFVDPAPIHMRDLPDGLTLLYGEGVDAAAYEDRTA